jgi:imidazolonepropionase-like amidohydrolase
VILSGAQDAWKVADMLAQKRIPVIINPAGRTTLSSNAPINQYDPYDTTFALPHLLKKAGVQHSFATEDNSGSFLLSLRAGTSVGFGSRVEDILRACTLDAATILGVGDKLGSLDRGKLANVVLADGDLFQSTTNVCAAWIAGKPIPMTSKFTRLRDQYLERL